MKIAVIGAGSAGLAALRHCTSDTNNTQVICYEKTDQVGGTWVYREETGLDRYGLPIHTSMYKNLRTNLPKEVMGYPDYPVPDNPDSYLTRTQILEFLNSYCDHFNLRQHIQFLHNVELVEPSVGDRKWMIKVKDLKRNIILEESFDAVMICNGHYFEPSIPNLKGQQIFQGEQLHSHDYRKPDIKELTKHGVIFKDDTNESVDAIFYCTGYKYSFPFLSEKCGVRVDSNMVTPLWKHLISIENPTLALIGLPFYVCAFSMFDLQVRFVLRYWSGKKDFPPKADMLKEEAQELESRKKEGLEKKHFHMMGFKQDRYYDDLANTAGITPLPPVLTKLHNESSLLFLDDLVHYREKRYKIIDDYNFIQL